MERLSEICNYRRHRRQELLGFLFVPWEIRDSGLDLPYVVGLQGAKLAKVLRWRGRCKRDCAENSQLRVGEIVYHMG